MNPLTEPSFESLSAITLATHDMQRAVRFYQTLGFRLLHGGAHDAFTSFAVGGSFLNLIAETHGPIQWWGRVIIYVSDVDALYRNMLAAGIKPNSPRAMRPGTSAISTSPIPTDTNSASRIQFPTTHDSGTSFA